MTSLELPPTDFKLMSGFETGRSGRRNGAHAILRAGLGAASFILRRLGLLPLLKRIVRPSISIALLSAGVAFVGYYYGFDNVLAGIEKLSPITIGLIASGLLANAIAAALRFKIVSHQTGHEVEFRQAMAAVGTSSLAGALVFQIIGQLMARGFIMRRANMPFAAVVAVTLYERIVAALDSGLLALGGALYIFGRIYLDQNEGGAALVKIICGLLAATTAGALLGFGRSATRSIAPFITRNFARACLRIVALTLFVQVPMMSAYVAAAHSVSPQVAIAELVAASSIVMFAASVPISLAGWGVREMSAIVALGTIGVAANDALTVAIVIGAGSMLSMAIISMIGWSRANTDQPIMETRIASSIDYARAFAWCLPIAAAIFVLFQIYVPVGSGLINVNLADPVAMLAGALFVLNAINRRRLPRWRVDYINPAIAAATIAVGVSLLVGAFRFGWTDWALVNRFFGWFVLLAYGATGALVVDVGKRDGFMIMLLTYTGATAAVALLEFVLVFLHAQGVSLSPAIVVPGGVTAFSQNHNFFAFQLLMAMAAALVIVRGNILRIVLWTVMLTAFWLAGSRSGWLSIACVLAAAVYLRVATIREIVIAIFCSACLIGVPVFVHIFSPNFSFNSETVSGLLPQVLPSDASTNERIKTWIGGWRLFIEHPIFGAGLGAFRNEHILAASGIPLVIHSTALWLLAELGVVGFLIFALPAVYVWGVEWIRARRKLAPGSAVIALSFLAFAVMSGPADMVYQRTFWLLIGATLALPRHRHRPEPA